jgi:hypothetical protein
VASLEAGNPPDITRLGAGAVQFYRSQGHLLDVTDPWWRRCSKSRAASSRSPWASSCIRAEPMGFLSPSAPGRWSPVWISSRVRKSRLPQRGTSSSRSVRSCRPPPNSPAMACAWACKAMPIAR